MLLAFYYITKQSFKIIKPLGSYTMFSTILTQPEFLFLHFLSFQTENIQVILDLKRMRLESLTTSLRSVARELRRGLKEREEEAAIVVEEVKARVLLRAVLPVREARVGGTVNSFRHCQLQLSIYIQVLWLLRGLRLQCAPFFPLSVTVSVHTCGTGTIIFFFFCDLLFLIVWTESRPKSRVSSFLHNCIIHSLFSLFSFLCPKGNSYAPVRTMEMNFILFCQQRKWNN